jgi:hypothetical protein
MSKKKTTPATSTTLPTGSGNTPSLKIGSRVRCTDDGITGKITWANGVSVKIKWADGEQVTWRRDSLAGRPIEILDAEADAAADAQPEQPAVVPAAEQPTTPEALPAVPVATVLPAAEQASTPEATAAPEATTAEQEVAVPSATVPEPPAVPEPTQAESGVQQTLPAWEAELQAARPEPLSDQAGDSQPDTPVAIAQPKRERKPKVATEPKEKKVSALDAAAKVLAEAGQAMTCKEMIGAMAAKGYWSSPGGQTPDATLCSAILREIKVKGDKSRFVKAAPGRFAFRPTA